MKNKIFISTFTAVIFTFMIAIVLAQPVYNQGCGMMSGLYGSYGSGLMFFSWLTYILFIGLLIAGIYWLIKSANKKK